MSYLGRRGAASPLTSGDIPADVVQGTDIAYLENDSTTQNLGGTYSTERMYLNDSYTLNNNVTVTGHLALGTIADSDIVITNDSSARTITGSGTLEAGRVMNDTPSLTGMTGELGSAVTGSPNLNLSNSSFPAGHILNVYGFYNRDAYSLTGYDNWTFIDSGSIAFNGGKILMIGSVSVRRTQAGSHNVGFFFVDGSTHLTGASGNSGNSWQNVVSSTGFTGSTSDSLPLNGSFLYTHGQSVPYTTSIKINIENSDPSYHFKLNRPDDNDAGDNTVRTMSASSLILFDIA